MNEISGLLNINKQSGVTSFQTVSRVKKILEIKKAGHCGTLDQPAEGVLLVLFGKATKLQDAFMKSRKLYRARLLLGVTTDTADITGKVLTRSGVPDFSRATVEEAVNRFKGEITQITPLYSAVKVNGLRLHNYARQGLEVKCPPRVVSIYNIQILELAKDTLDISVECSSGTYIRALGEDIGKALGCGAAVQYLLRQRVGPFDVSDAIDGKKIQEYTKDDLLSKSFSVEQLQGYCQELNEKQKITTEARNFVERIKPENDHRDTEF